MKEKVTAADTKEKSAEQPKVKWFIDLGWYPQNSRSFSALAGSRLCPKCSKRLSRGDKEISANAILSAIRDCCSQEPGYINDQLPVLESIFRVFLANGNQPLDVEELGQRLNEWRGADAYRTSGEVLPRILENERYYGLRRVE